MPRYLLVAALACSTLVSACASGARGSGATRPPLSLSDVEEMVRGGMRTPRILEVAGQECISFIVDDASVAQLNAAGADAALIDGLQDVCNPEASARTRNRWLTIAGIASAAIAYVWYRIVS